MIMNNYTGYIILLLEIPGIIIMITSLFIFVFYSIKHNNIKNNIKFILSGIIIFIFNFIFAIAIENKISNINNVPIEWLKISYFIDFYMISVDSVIIFKLLKNYFISALEYFALYFYISLFLFGFIISNTINLYNYYLIIFGAISIYFLLISIFGSFIDFNHKLNWFKINGNEFTAMSVKGKSMDPEFKAGNLIIIKKIKSIDEIKKGDIITYKTSNIYSPLNASEYITHRIYDISGNIIRTKGDNNKKIDPIKIKLGDVLGIVVAKVVYINRKTTSIETVGDNSNKEDLLYFTPFNVKRKSSIIYNIYFIIISLILILIIL